ncbi:hypothetical protein JHK84_046780 [Glycine max]|nr:hypothetical protein JHK84_046780 [Glycine max]
MPFLCACTHTTAQSHSEPLLNSAMETLDSARSTPSKTTDSNPQTSSPLPSSVLRSQLGLGLFKILRELSLGWCARGDHLGRIKPMMSLAKPKGMQCFVFPDKVNYEMQFELRRSELVLSYRDMVGIVSDMINVSRSMKCFFKGSNNSSLLHFSYNSADQSDSGDGGGIPAFTFYSITSHGEFQFLRFSFSHLYLIPTFGLIGELISNGQRLLVLEFMSISYDTSAVKQLHWSTQLYDDEFKDLRDCNLYCVVTHGPVPPRLRDGKSGIDALRFDNQPNPEVLQVYLTTWLAEVNMSLPSMIAMKFIL